MEVDALYWHHAYDDDDKGDVSVTVGGLDARTHALSAADRFSGAFVGTEARLAVPVLVRVGLPLIPLLLKLSAGGGLEPRFLLGASSDDNDAFDDDAFEAVVLYLPVVLGVDIDLSVTELRLEARFEVQLTNHLSSAHQNPDDQRIHEGMLFAGVFF